LKGSNIEEASSECFSDNNENKSIVIELQKARKLFYKIDLIVKQTCVDKPQPWKYLKNLHKTFTMFVYITFLQSWHG
jgi:hypothetical protein